MATITLPKKVSAYQQTIIDRFAVTAPAANTAQPDGTAAASVDTINTVTSDLLEQAATNIDALAFDIINLQNVKADKVDAVLLDPIIDNATLDGNTSISVIKANNSVGTTGQYLASGGGNTMYWATFSVAGTPSLDAVVGVNNTTNRAISIGNTSIVGYANVSSTLTVANTARVYGHTTIGGIAGSTSSGNQTSLEVLNTGGTGDSDVAAISFHCSGYYGIHQHLRADGYFGIGGWSATTWRWYVNMANGDMTAAGNVTAYSDPRLKEDIKPIDSALAKVLKWNGVKYRWKQNSVIGKPGTYDYGVLSSDIEPDAPELVVDSVWDSADGDKYKTVAYAKITPFLIEAIKEQQKAIEQLQQQVAALVERLPE